MVILTGAAWPQLQSPFVTCREGSLQETWFSLASFVTLGQGSGPVHVLSLRWMIGFKMESLLLSSHWPQHPNRFLLRKGKASLNSVWTHRFILSGFGFLTKILNRLFLFLHPLLERAHLSFCCLLSTNEIHTCLWPFQCCWRWFVLLNPSWREYRLEEYFPVDLFSMNQRENFRLQ